MFDPKAFLNLAKRLVSADEAETRTAISRAYYAAFLLARQKLQIQQGIPQVHQFVVDSLYRHGLRTTAHKLHILRRLRNSADYDVNGSMVAAQAVQAIKWSEDITHQMAKRP